MLRLSETTLNVSLKYRIRPLARVTLDRVLGVVYQLVELRQSGFRGLQFYSSEHDAGFIPFHSLEFRETPASHDGQSNVREARKLCALVVTGRSAPAIKSIHVNN